MSDAPPGLEQAAVQVLRTLRQNGHETYFAGGCVRNRLLGLAIPDIDIATSARPEQIESLFPDAIPVGRAFGVLIVPRPPHQFEVATFRSDGRYLDGRHPESVTFADHRSDVLRRDFTINGMLYDPIEDRILDLVGGQEDLKRNLIRTIGNPTDRFEEDKLRLLRAIRFACLLDFRIEGTTWEALTRIAPDIVQVSAERIRDEFLKILKTPRRSQGLDLLDRSGLLKILFPELEAMKGVPQPPQFHPEGDVWTHTRLAMEKLEDPTAELALATLLHDVGKPRTITRSDRIRFHGHDRIGAQMTDEICRRLRLSNDHTARIVWLVDQHLALRQAAEMRTSTLKRLMAHEFFPDLELLHRADTLASHGDLSALDVVRRVREATPVLRPAPLLRGEDLLGLGVKPGPDLGRILRAAYDAQLEGTLRSHEDALEFARKSLPPIP